MGEPKQPPSYEELAEKNRELTSSNTELKHMTGDRIVYSEPPYSFNATLSRHGIRGQFTVRVRPGDLAEDFLWRIDKVLEKCLAHGWGAGEGQQVAVSTGAATQAPPPPATTPSAPPANGGTARAVLMKVGKSYKGDKPQLQFECDGMKDPLRFTKSVPEMIKLLNGVGQYTGDMLTEGKKYAVNYLIDWEYGPPNDKGIQYQNITQIRPG